MDCKTTSIKRRQAGATLIELMFTLGIGSLLLLMVSGLSIYSGRSFAALVNYADLDNKSRNALDRLTRDVRQVENLVMFTKHQVSFAEADGVTLHWVYSPTARTLRRIKGTLSETILTECDFLEFSIYQRNPIEGTYDIYPTATASTCKLVQVSWICSRKVFGTKMHTESVQTAKIVIRKK
jgi:hypothetical protein